jgi:hypothetical protein
VNWAQTKWLIVELSLPEDESGMPAGIWIASSEQSLASKSSGLCTGESQIASMAIFLDMAEKKTESFDTMAELMNIE